MTDVISETAEALETAIEQQTVDSASTATVVAAAVASEAIESGIEQGVARATNIVRDEIETVASEVIQWQQVDQKVEALRGQITEVQMSQNNILAAMSDLTAKLTTQTTVVIPPSPDSTPSLEQPVVTVESATLEPDLDVAGVPELQAPPARRAKVGSWI